MKNLARLTTQNTIFYSTANAGYAVYAAVSLLTVRDYLPDAKLYILSSGLSSYDKKILRKHNIDFQELDLRHIFTKTWDYPIDSYYIFAGPEIFYEKGYEYSVYIDGDILCAGNPLEGVNDIDYVGGVTSKPQNGSYAGIFGKDWESIKTNWKLPEQAARRPRINSGSVYFRNRSMNEFGLLKRAGELFQTCLSKGMPRKGDDSLFSLLQYIYFKEEYVTHLPNVYNYVLQFNENWKYPVNKLKFFHFSIDKPWKKHPYRHINKQLYEFNPYVKQWRSKLRSIAPRVWMRSSIKNILIAPNYTPARRAKSLLKEVKQWTREELRGAPTPIFIISYNRKELLEKALASYRQLKNIRIIIHDNGSDDIELLNYYEQLKKKGVLINYRAKLSVKNDLENINYSIEKYFRFRRKTNYIVSDPDIELLPGSANTIDIYNSVLQKLIDIESVGPMLKIDDIPKDYPLYNAVINRHIDQFWSQKPEVVDIDGQPIALLRSKIDTTFSMHRAGKKFRRLSEGARLYGKYSARHLDWYRPKIEDKAYYSKSNSTISHWGNKVFHGEVKNESLRHKFYNDIEYVNGATIKIVKRRLQQ